MLAAGGEGWNSGAFGTLALIPVTFMAAVNALARAPSKVKAYSLLGAGIVVCALVAVSTLGEGTYYFFKTLSQSGTGFVPVMIGISLSWLLTCALALFRTRAGNTWGSSASQ